MISYEYYCSANNKTVSVQHRMSESISTWGELCQRAGIEATGTDLNAPVERLIFGGTLALKKDGASSAPARAADVISGRDDCVPAATKCCGGGCK